MSDTPSAPPAFFSASTVPDETYTITRRQLIGAIANIRIEGVRTSGPGAGLAIADDMADAILAQIPPATAGGPVVAMRDLGGAEAAELAGIAQAAPPMFLEQP